MYAFMVVETDNAVQSLIARIFLESAGYPSVAAGINIAGELHYTYFTAAPAGEPQKFEAAIKAFSKFGPRGVKLAQEAAELAQVVLRDYPNPLQVPVAMRDTVRNALLHTLYTAAQDEDSSVVFSEPAYSTLVKPEHAVPTTMTDAPTAPVKMSERNPQGGGFDGSCQGADRWAHLNHDPGDEHHRPYFSA